MELTLALSQNSKAEGNSVRRGLTDRAMSKPVGLDSLKGAMREAPTRKGRAGLHRTEEKGRYLMELLEELKGLGVDVKEGMDRVMGDESLYTMMLDMFVSAIQTTPIQAEDFDAADLQGLIGKVHTLKGTTGNLSITPLFTRYTRSLELLREGKPAQAKQVYLELLPAQDEIMDCIRRHQG